MEEELQRLLEAYAEQLDSQEERQARIDQLKQAIRLIRRVIRGVALIAINPFIFFILIVWLLPSIHAQSMGKQTCIHTHTHTRTDRSSDCIC
mmetsp:Transcript_26008/g.64558  ORF Transcript_26008/g.64558 Transcript_26008/m.64558 type:complete len:92 (+) Transcript_26008:45-320(+)